MDREWGRGWRIGWIGSRGWRFGWIGSRVGDRALGG